MSVLSTTTKAGLGLKATKAVAKNPRILRVGAKAGSKAVRPTAILGWRLGKPVVTRQTRRKLQRFGDVLGTTLAVYGPEAAQQLGLAEPPKQKRTAPRVAAGVVIGASAMYFLEPEHGREHREQVLKLVS